MKPGKQEPDYYCDECGAGAPAMTYDEYRTHMESEHGKSFFCDVELTRPSDEVGPCGAAFATEEDLAAHKAQAHADA
jgi:hypothetical protein